jgi:non-specific serine/threonine protein kinase
LPGGLSRREYEVVTQIARGLTNREIAGALSVSEKTIEMHVSHSLNKLQVRSRAQLAAWVTGQLPPGELLT